MHCPEIYDEKSHSALSAPSAAWHLVKLPKTAKVHELREAAAVALETEVQTLQTFNFYPVQRKTFDGECVKVDGKLIEIGTLDLLLAALPPDQLQVIQLVFSRDAPKPVDVPMSPKVFPTCGVCLPFMGNNYQYQGPSEILEYNFAQNVFPANGGHPYGSTVRFYDGQKQQVGEFGATLFHEDAQYTETMTADANIVAELISRSADFPKLWNRAVEVGVQDSWDWDLEKTTTMYLTP